MLYFINAKMKVNINLVPLGRKEVNKLKNSFILAYIKKLFFITVAVTLLAIGVNLFLGPHEIAAGGVTGLAILLEELLGLDRSIVVFVFNLGIFVLALVFLGKEVFLNTLFGGLLLPFVIGLIPHTMAISDKMLSVIFGSIIFGVGVSILFQNKASSGGTSIPPLILKKYFDISTSIGLLITDAIIVILSIYVFGWESFFFAIFSMVITAITMNYIETGTNRKKTIMMMSHEVELIVEDIYKEIKRGVTLIPVEGGYEREQRQILMITLNNKDYQQVRTIINTHDPKAFVIAYNVADIQGKGFTYESRYV